MRLHRCDEQLCITAEIRLITKIRHLRPQLDILLIYNTTVYSMEYLYSFVYSLCAGTR